MGSSLSLITRLGTLTLRAGPPQIVTFLSQKKVPSETASLRRSGS